MAKTKRSRTPVYGMIDPSRLYTREGVRKAIGIGEQQLSDARRAGIVKAIPCGNFVYYRGADIIAWIESHAPVSDESSGNPAEPQEVIIPPRAVKAASPDSALPFDREGFATVAEVAKFLALPKNAVYKLINDGELPTARYNERTRRVPRAAVIQYVKDKLFQEQKQILHK